MSFFIPGEYLKIHNEKFSCIDDPSLYMWNSHLTKKMFFFVAGEYLKIIMKNLLRLDEMI